MITIDNVSTCGWEPAIRGMRNPKNSWDRSDSDWEFIEDPNIINPNCKSNGIELRIIKYDDDYTIEDLI